MEQIKDDPESEKGQSELRSIPVVVVEEEEEEGEEA